MVLHSDGIPLKMIFQTSPFLKRSKRATDYLKHIVDFSLNKVDRIVFLSHRAKMNFLSLYPQYENKVHVIYNGLDDLENQTHVVGSKVQGEKIKIASVGTVGERKGFDLLIEAFLSLHKNIRDKCELHIIGDGPLRERLDKMSDGDKNIIFWGKRNDINEILSEMDVFALVSRDEGMPMAVIEAMRQGKALLLTNVGGMGEMVTGKYNGWLVEPNVDSVFKGFCDIVNDEQKIYDFSKNSRSRFLSEFQGGIMIEKYKSIFHNLAIHDK
jgi:glycosyltransferase involved in cell wall biosynthesis